MAIRNTLLQSISIVFLLAFSSLAQTVLTIDDIGIEVTSSSRVFSFTNKAFGQYHGETNSQSVDGWRGWFFQEQNIFKDYSISQDNIPLPRETSKCTVFPHTLKRIYPSGIIEQFVFADSIDYVGIHLSGLNKSITFTLKDFGFDSSFSVNANSTVIYSSSLPQSYCLLFTSQNSSHTILTNNRALSIEINSPDGKYEIGLRIIKINATVFPETSFTKIMMEKQGRINSIFDRARVTTNNPDLNKAILWAAASLDALITVQEVKGIFAGLPWFNNNWGRDTFISLIGSTFCLNNFQDAKEILEAFAAFQIKDSLNEYYGRVPNRITLKESIYNTTDGTPLFVIQCLNYAKNSGDTNFIKKNYPVIKIALLGALKYYVDKDCLLTHKDAETWMDAVGPEGPWSPRGNRAVDIQVLWLGQVQATATVAAMLNDTTISALCSRLEPKIVYNIKKKFFDTLAYKIADRITTEGKLDFSERPNSLFATAESTLFKNEFERFKYFSNSAKNILLSQGVLSLSYKDKNFHPYHEYPPFYPKDAAYHNGIIWQWNTGIAVDNLCSFGLQDTAWKLTQTLTNQILNQGAVGSIAELMEVYSRTNSNYTKLSGCFSQAWSLAEYIRSFREAYFGITTDALSNTIAVTPHIPSGINYAKFIVNYKDSKFLYEYQTTGDKIIFKFTPARVNSSVKVYFKYTDVKQTIALNFCMDSTAAIITAITDKSGLARLLFNKTVQISKTKMKQQLTGKKLASSVNNFLLAHPVYNKNLKCFAAKAYPLIPFSTIKHSNPNAKVIYDKSDLPFDEKYTYPQNSNFRAGISDILNFNLSEDGNLYYFTILLRDLVNPSWHPEYGFQLTYLAILIRNSNSNFCNTVNKNSNYILSDSLSYNKAIYIGGGIEVSNYDGKIIAQYIPAQTDITNPLGNIYEKSLRFAIPKRLLGKINNKCKITLLSGTQDDNGGAGLGIFRNVTMQVSEWSGGGKTNSNDNIYDELFIP